MRSSVSSRSPSGLLLSSSLLLLLYHSHTAASQAAFPAPTAHIIDDTSKVVVKLNRGLCNWRTGHISAVNLQQVKNRAAREGLQYVRQLRPNCWHVFEPVNGQDKTAAAIASLTPDESGSSDQYAAAGATAAALSKPFAIAGFDASKKAWYTKPERNPSVSFRSRRRRIKDPAVAATDGLLRPADYPEECPDGKCLSMWNFNYIKVSEVWNAAVPIKEFAKKGAIVDTGMDFDHNDLRDQVDQTNSATFNAGENLPEGGWADRNLSPDCLSYHGTHVMGTVAGGWGNGDTRGIAGILGPSQASVIMCNCFSIETDRLPCSPTGTQVTYTDAAISDCLGHANNVSAHNVINLSLGGLYLKSNSALQLQRDAVEQFVCDNDGIVVAAAGNYQIDISSSGTISNFNYEGMWPANFAEEFPECVLAVAAVDDKGKLAEFSNYGAAVRLAAPGIKIFSDSLTYFDGNSSDPNLWNSATLQGTSMAAPHVTGVIMVIRNAFPAAKAPTVVNCLLSTATTKAQPPDKYPTRTIGGGILNPLAAYNCVKAAVNGGSSPTPSPPPGPPSPSPATDKCPTRGLPRCVDVKSGTIVQKSSCTGATYCKKVNAEPQGLDTLLVRYKPRSWHCKYDLLPANTTCYAQTSCFSGSACTGTSPDCPNGTFVPDGTACTDHRYSSGTMVPAGGSTDSTIVQVGGTSAVQRLGSTVQKPLEVYCRRKNDGTVDSNSGGTNAIQRYMQTLDPSGTVPGCLQEAKAAAAAVQQQQEGLSAAAAAVADGPRTAPTPGWYRRTRNNNHNMGHNMGYNNYNSYNGQVPYSGTYMQTGQQALYDCGRCQLGQCMEVGQWRCTDSTG